jgi:hypothetical protein
VETLYKCLGQIDTLKSDVATVMKALETLCKFADKGVVKYELTRTVSAMSNARRQPKPEGKTEEFARPSFQLPQNGMAKRSVRSLALGINMLQGVVGH